MLEIKAEELESKDSYQRNIVGRTNAGKREAEIGEKKLGRQSERTETEKEKESPINPESFF